MRVIGVGVSLALLILAAGEAVANATIRELSGSGTRNTRPFQPQGPWEVKWNAKGEIFQVFVYTASGDLVGVAANQQGAGTGASYQPIGGNYYIQINALGSWSIEIVAVSEPAASADDSGQILSLSGNGTLNTRPFKATVPWEIRWDAKGDIFQVFVYTALGDLVGVAANQQGSGDGASYQPKRGTYYLGINALGMWSIEMVEVR